MVYTLIANEYASLLFSQTIFFFLLLHMLSEFDKVFERKVWRVQVAQLHNAVRALLSRSRCFQLWANVDKDFLCYLWYCGKKKNQTECGLPWSVLLSTTIQVITVVKICCENIFSSDTSTKRETAIFEICPFAIITSSEVIIAECDAILGQWEREDFYNHLSNYTKYLYIWPRRGLWVLWHNSCLITG